MGGVEDRMDPDGGRQQKLVVDRVDAMCAVVWSDVPSGGILVFRVKAEVAGGEPDLVTYMAQLLWRVLATMLLGVWSVSF